MDCSMPGIQDSIDCSMSGILVQFKGKGWGKGQLESLESTCTHVIFKMDKQQAYCIAQGTLFNIMWQPGWKGSLGENGYMYMYD